VAAWKGKTRGGLVGYKIFITTLKHLGLPFAYFLLRFVAFYFFVAAPASFRNVLHFYRKRLGWGIIGSVAAIYRNYFVFGQVILDNAPLTGQAQDCLQKVGLVQYKLIAANPAGQRTESVLNVNVTSPPEGGP